MFKPVYALYFVGAASALSAGYSFMSSETSCKDAIHAVTRAEGRLRPIEEIKALEEVRKKQCAQG